MPSGPLALARGHTTSTTGLCPLPRLWHMGLHGCALSVTCPSCQLIPRAVHWCVSLPRTNLGPAPLPFTIFCPPTLSRAGRDGAHRPRHFRAEVRSPERPVPGWLPCLYHLPPWRAGVEARVPLLSQMCPAGVLGPTSAPAGPSTRVSPSELPGRTAAAPGLWLWRLQATAAAGTARSPDTLLS